MNKLIALLTALLILAPNATFAATENNLSIEGKIVTVVAAKKEIYVAANGQKYEFYFKDDTTLTHADAVVPFSEISEGASVKVTYRQIGKRTEPISVELK